MYWQSLFAKAIAVHVALTSAVAATSPAPAGPYETKSATFTYSALDPTNRKIDVVYPKGTTDQAFPLIVYAHGFSDEAYASYGPLFRELASWGYVVAAPLACQFGCLVDCKSLPNDPSCYGNYYKEQLKVIEWARTAKLPINSTAGVGVAGHSMGGQATLFSAAYNASTHDIRAAVMHHAYTHNFPAISTVPFLTFTGRLDTTAPPEMAQNIFDAQGAFGERGLVNKLTANHHEPSTQYNPDLGWFTVAWFKVHLDCTPKVNGIDFEDLLYGTGKSSLCHGGDGLMSSCTMLHKGLDRGHNLLVV